VKLVEFKGWKLKRDLGVDRAQRIYHNKLADGSGNFGYLILKGDKWFRIDAEYSPSHEITWISISTFKLDHVEYMKVEDYDEFTERARRFITDHSQ